MCYVVTEAVALAAALDTALVGAGVPGGIAAATTAVLEQARVPLQPQPVAAGARLPCVP